MHTIQIFMLHFSGNVMITSGAPQSSSRHTEIIDLIDPKNHWLVNNCDLDEPRYGSIGALLNNQPLICGGRAANIEFGAPANILSNVTSWIGPKTIGNCEDPEEYIGQPCRLTPMSTARDMASSIVLNEI